ncbi:helix-turn-helix domain-containing protein [Nonomuraea sp. NPDC003560]|uniref:helix-turn-helix domain-containing protein n=1 Tax=Nonomuraea sp. NPDC003560 TaxID=3364341 RepID=UPI00367ECC47
MPHAPARIRPLHQNPKAVLRRRLLARLEQAEVAERAQISPSHMSKIETGARSASVDVLHRLAIALECTVEELIAE